MATDSLRGCRIVVTRMREQSGELEALLRAEGAEPVVCPAIMIAPPEDFVLLDVVIDRLHTFDLIVFTSANSIESLVSRMRARGVSMPASGPAVATVGPATARVAEAHGFQVKIIPEHFIAESLLGDLRKLEQGKALLLRGDIGRSTVNDGLVNAGWDVHDVVAYRTIPGDGIEELGRQLRLGRIDAVTFSSSSSVRYTAEGLKRVGDINLLVQGEDRPAVICLGPVTADTAREMGLIVDAVARQFDARGLVDALREWFTNRKSVHA